MDKQPVVERVPKTGGWLRMDAMSPSGQSKKRLVIGGTAIKSVTTFVKRFRWALVFVGIATVVSIPPLVFDMGEKWLNWGTTSSALSQWALVLGGIWIGWEYRRHQTRAAASRQELALNVEVKPRVFSEAGYLFLESIVEVSNPTHRTWAIAAAYISVRALVDTKNPMDYKGKVGFSGLHDCGILSEEQNRAYYGKTIIKVAPNEKEQFVRYDRVEGDFAERYPVVVVNAEVFGADESLANPDGPYRAKWLEYTTAKEREGRSYDVFDRFEPGVVPALEGFRGGDRYFKLADGTPDEKWSEEFKWFLTTQAAVVQWSRFRTVNMRLASRKAAGARRRRRRNWEQQGGDEGREREKGEAGSGSSEAGSFG